MSFDVGSIVGYLELKKSKWDASIKSVKADQKSLSGLVARNSQQFKKMGRAMTVAGGVVVSAVGLMVKAYADFDQAMTESLAIMGDVSDDMRKQMSDVARTISEETTYSAKELAAAYYYLASAGFDAEQSVGALGDVARFAQAGAFDLSMATDLLTDAQTAMGLSSKNATENQKELVRVSDVLVGANTLANASVQQFAEALVNKAAPALVNVNKGLEEGVATLAAFADRGVKGRKAGMQLAMMLNAIDIAARRNKKEWEALGLTLFDANGEMLEIGELIGSLEVALGDMTPEMRGATLETLGFTAETKNSILTLMGSSEKITLWTKELKKMGGLTKEVSDKQLKTLNAQLKILRNVTLNAAISLGESLAPTITKLIVKVKDIVKKVSEWIKEHPKLTEWIGLTALKVGGLLLVLGPLLMMLPGLIQGMNFLGISSAKAALGMKALLGPIGVVAAASLVAYNITKKLIKAKEDLIEADYRAFEAEHKMGQKLREIADAAGLTRKEFIELTRKYKGNTNALAIAIFRGKEGVELQKAMKKYGKEHAEQVIEETSAVDKLAKAFMEGKITLEEYLEKLKALESGHKGLGKTIKKISEEITNTIKTMTDEIKEATLDEFEYRKWKAQEIYEERKALFEKEGADRDVFVLLEKSRATTLAEIEEDITEKQREETEKRETLLKDFAAKISIAHDEYWKRIKEKHENFKGYISEYTDIIKQYTLSETDYKKLKLKEWYDNQVKLLKSSLGNSEKYYEALGLLNDAYALKTEELTNTITIQFQSMSERFIGLAMDMGDAFGNFAMDIMDKGSTLGENLKGLWADIGNSFKSMVAEYIADEMKKLFLSIVGKTTEMAASVTAGIASIGPAIAGIATGLAGLITTLATAIATAATTLAAAAPALMVVLGIALAAYAGFKILSSLIKKKADTQLGYIATLLEDINWIQLNAINLKLDTVNFFLSEMFPKIDYTNSILAKIENINKGIRGYTKKIDSGISAIVSKLGSLAGFQTGAMYVPRTQMAVVHAGETITPREVMPPPGISQTAVTGRGVPAGAERLNVSVFVKPLLIPRGDKYIVDFVIEDIKHGRKIPIEAIGG